MTGKQHTRKILSIFRIDNLEQLPFNHPLRHMSLEQGRSRILLHLVDQQERVGVIRIREQGLQLITLLVQPELFCEVLTA